MDPGVFVPLAVSAFVVMIVALTSFAGLHDREMQTREALGRAEFEHRSHMAELDRELARLRQGS